MATPTLASLASSTFTPSTTAPSNFTPAAPFTAPTAAQAQATPGYQFTQQQALGAAQNSAAGQGMLSSGNTLSGLATLAGGIADSTYQNSYNNALQAQQSNYGQGLSTSQQQAALQAQQYGQQSNTYQMNQTNALNAIEGQNTFTVGQENAQAAQQAAQAQQANASTNALYQGESQAAQTYGEDLSTFNTNYGIGQTNQNTAWNENMQLANLGNPGAPNTANYGSNQANLLTQQGNVNAAGQIGSANPYASAVGNLSGLATGAVNAANAGQPPQYLYGNQPNPVGYPTYNPPA